MTVEQLAFDISDPSAVAAEAPEDRKIEIVSSELKLALFHTTDVDELSDIIRQLSSGQRKEFVAIVQNATVLRDHLRELGSKTIGSNRYKQYNEAHAQPMAAQINERIVALFGCEIDGPDEQSSERSLIRGMLCKRNELFQQALSPNGAAIDDEPWDNRDARQRAAHED